MAAKLIGCRGYTLAEILLSISLLTIVLLTLLGLCLRTLQSSRKSIDTGAGQIVADQALEQLAFAAESSATAPVWLAPSSVTVAYSTDTVTVQGTSFEVTTYAADVVASAAPFFVPGKRLRQLTTRVIWKDLAQGKMGYGRLNAQASRLVHEP